VRKESRRIRAPLWAILGGCIAGCSTGSGAADRSLSDAASPAEAGGVPRGAEGGADVGGEGAADAGQDSNDAPSGLNPKVAPGGNFDLSVWELQEPVGSPGNPTTIPPAALEGPNGFHDAYFFTDTTDGAITFWDPENGVTTANSSYPRSELREMNADGSEANWAIAGTNTLSATLEVSQVPDHVCVGQIHIGTALDAGLAASTKPLLELYYYASGAIELGIEDGPTGSQTTHAITSVPLGTKFRYVLQLTGTGTITLVIDGTTSTFTMPSSFNGYGQYFKAGDYDQTVGSDATVGATVKFYALQITHGS
jgi:hypothetical protein